MTTINATGAVPLATMYGGTGTTTSTGSGNNVLSVSPTLTTPVLGTPSSGTLTSCTGLPLTTGVTGTLPIANGGTAVTSVTTSPTATSFAGWDANSNLASNNFNSSLTAITTAASTTTLTVASTAQTYFTGSSNQTVKLPVVSTLSLGQAFYIINNSSGTITVVSSGSNTILAMATETSCLFTCVAITGTGTSSWSYEYVFQNATSGTVTSVAMTVPTFLSISGSPITSSGTLAVSLSGTALPVANGGTGLTSTTINQLLYSSANSTIAGLSTVDSASLLTNSSGVPGWVAFTGSGSPVLATSPTLVSPVLGTPSSGTLTNCTGLSLTSGVTGTLPIANGGTSITSFGTGVATALGQNVTGSGSIVLATSPSLVTPALGTPASGVMTNVTGLPLTSGVTGILPVANGGTSVSSVTTSPNATSFAGGDGNLNLSANNNIQGYATTVTSGGTTTLVVGSAYQQYFTGSASHTVKLPVVSSFALGQSFYIVNNSSGLVVTIESSGGNTVQAMASNTWCLVTCILTSGTSASSWNVEYGFQAPTSGTVTSVAASVPTFLSISGSPITSNGTLAITLSGTALPVLNGGTGTTTSTGSGNVVLSTSPTLVTPVLGAASATTMKLGNGGILDTNGNTILALNPQASAVNHLEIINQATGISPQIVGIGSDTNVGLTFVAQAAGLYEILTTATSQQVNFQCGTSYAGQSYFTFPSTSANNTYTFPNATGTVQLSGSSLSGTNLVTAPAASGSSSLTLGTAYQNTLGYDIMLVVYLQAAATGVKTITLGVGSTSTPTAQTIVNDSVTSFGWMSAIPIYLPNNYYALLTITSGTITISGQHYMAI